MRGMTFWGNRRAAATALTAAVMTVMSLGGFAFIADHTHLVYQRDILKAATDAATLATTRHLLTLDAHLSEEAVHTALRPIARRYILANIPARRRERATETLTLTLVPNRTAGTVDITAQADLGGIIFGSWLYGNMVPSTKVGSLSEQEHEDEVVETPPPPGVTEVVLALDVTGSMNYNPERTVWMGPMAQRRIGIVKRAAENLVNTITTDTDRTVAVGLVPWSYRIRLDRRTRTRWEDLGWAQYPDGHYYANPYDGSWRSNSSQPYPDPHRPAQNGEWYAMPDRNGQRWHGCVEQRSMNGDQPPGIHATLPTQEWFWMSFYTPRIPNLQKSVSYQCEDREQQFRCYNDPHHPRYGRPQEECQTFVPSILPLTTDVERVKQRIRRLEGVGAATYSTLGVTWGHRLLAPSWRTIWNDAVHPMDTATQVRKVLVLLTDGEDNHLGQFQGIERRHRRAACTAAKAAGIEVMTIFAGEPGRGTRRELEWCASPTEDEDETNVFVGETEAELEGVFETIGQRLRPLRLVR